MFWHSDKADPSLGHDTVNNFLLCWPILARRHLAENRCVWYVLEASRPPYVALLSGFRRGVSRAGCSRNVLQYSASKPSPTHSHTHPQVSALYCILKRLYSVPIVLPVTGDSRIRAERSTQPGQLSATCIRCGWPLFSRYS